ncbi:MAG: hypothetical protein OQL19_19385 [Gammaproteobacteria bacterium]|nr:hypothetical protein [Gammaproteobacteria bacterium]
MSRKPLTLIMLIVLILLKPLFACDVNITCYKCAKESEFSWNPSNRYVSTRLNRFYTLDEKLKTAYSASNFGTTKSLIKEYLELAKIYKCNWNYGNAIHDANRYLALMSLKNNDIDMAGTYLLRAGKSSGSPQLDSFGPDLDLANQLLKLGKRNEVITYLNDVKLFWEMNDGRIDSWLEQINNGEQPELSRFSGKASFWQKLFFWVSSLWPFFIVSIFLIIKRNAIKKKWQFSVTGLVSGYMAMYVVNWTSTHAMTSIISYLSERGNDSMIMIVIYLFIALVYILPAIVIFAVSRAFQFKNIS